MSSVSSHQKKRKASTGNMNQSSSPPSSARAQDGIRNVHSSLRSIVMSPASFTLFRGFNPPGTSTSAAAAEGGGGHLEIKGLPSPPDFIKNTSTDHSHHSDLLKSCIEKVEATMADAQLETAITALLETKFNDAFGNNEGERCFTAKAEKRLRGGTGIVDLILSTEQKVPLGLVEVGLLRPKAGLKHKDQSEAWQLERRFWEKAGQATEYLRLLREDSAWKGEEALLLGVLVATRDCNKGRLAVFVCEPKGEDDWRMALLWRAELETRDKLSEAFGYYINGLVYLSKEGAKLTRKNNGIGIEWEYLGPDCTKVKGKDTEEKVLRSYDNRVRQTSRTPRVYKSWGKLKETMKPVLLIQDNDSDSGTVDFADYVAVDGPKTYDKSMLFSKWNPGDGKGGKVEVIAVPFVAGEHLCKNTKQALSLVTYMKELHKDGFVHGDIRGFNIVFKTDSDDAVLIDFDFGGKVDEDEPKYPPRYQKLLEDGYRSGKAGSSITKENDARDLAYVLGVLHDPPDDAPPEIRLMFYDLLKAKTLGDMDLILKSMGAVAFSPSYLYDEYLKELNGGTPMTETAEYGNKVTPDRAAAFIVHE